MRAGWLKVAHCLICSPKSDVQDLTLQKTLEAGLQTWDISLGVQQ